MPTCRRLAATALFVIASTLAGCAPKATFRVAITNQTDRPVTVGIVKVGPPYERAFATPEDVAMEFPLASSLPQWGRVIPPGRTMDSPPLTGTFPAGTTAHLRVYGGERSNAELLATSSQSPDRVDVLLFPGMNEITLHADRGGPLRARSASAPQR